MHPGIHFHRKFRCKFHSGLCITRLTIKQIIRQTPCQPDPPPTVRSFSIDRNFEFYNWPVFSSHFSIRGRSPRMLKQTSAADSQTASFFTALLPPTVPPSHTFPQASPAHNAPPCRRPDTREQPQGASRNDCDTSPSATATVGSCTSHSCRCPPSLAGTVKRLLKSGRNLCAENSLASSMPSRSRFCGLDLAETRVYASAVSGSFAGARMREACSRAEAVMEKAEISKKKKDEDREDVGRVVREQGSRGRFHERPGPARAPGAGRILTVRTVMPSWSRGTAAFIVPFQSRKSVVSCSTPRRIRIGGTCHG